MNLPPIITISRLTLESQNMDSIVLHSRFTFQSYEDTKDGVFKARTIKVVIVDSKLLQEQLRIQPFTKHDFYHNIQNIQKVLMKEQEQDYHNAQSCIPKKSLQRVTNASENILSYSKILENLSNPSDIMLQSYQKNLDKNIDWLKLEKQILLKQLEECQMTLTKVKAEKGLLSIQKGSITPGGPTPY